jgi:hypothetical protein
MSDTAVGANHGVPGAWITGNRTLDITVLPLFVAAVLPIIRVALVKHVFQVGLRAQGADLHIPAIPLAHPALFCSHGDTVFSMLWSRRTTLNGPKKTMAT